MTGERFTMATVPFQDGPYQPGQVAAPPTSPLPIRAVVLSTGGAGFPFLKKRAGIGLSLAADAAAFLFVVSMCDVDGGVVSLATRVNPNTGAMAGAWIQIGNGIVTFLMYRASGGGAVASANWHYAGTNRLTNFMIYAHAGDEVVQLVVGDALITPDTVTWTGSGDFVNPAIGVGGGDNYWALTAFLTSEATVRIVRFWATELVEPIDLSDTATRRPFVTAAGVPVPLPEDGAVDPYGVPTEYLHARVAANDFAGTGLNAWTIVDGPLAFDLAACFMP